jgi:hypothetical protein
MKLKKYSVKRRVGASAEDMSGMEHTTLEELSRHEQIRYLIPKPVARGSFSEKESMVYFIVNEYPAERRVDASEQAKAILGWQHPLEAEAKSSLATLKQLR